MQSACPKSYCIWGSKIGPQLSLEIAPDLPGGFWGSQEQQGNDNESRHLL
jgi:hypothetical protein